MEWKAICLECQDDGACKILDSAPNGVWVEATAKRHKKDNPGHVVIVAYEIKEV